MVGRRVARTRRMAANDSPRVVSTATVAAPTAATKGSKRSPGSVSAARRDPGRSCAGGEHGDEEGEDHGQSGDRDRTQRGRAQELAPSHAEGGERGGLGVFGDRLADQRLADEEQPGRGADERRDRERRGLVGDGLTRVPFPVEIAERGDAEVAARELLVEHGLEGGGVRGIDMDQDHVAPGLGVAAVAGPERGTGQGYRVAERQRIEPGDEVGRRADDADDYEPTGFRLAFEVFRRRGESDAVADPQAEEVREFLRDDDLARDGGIGQSPGCDPRRTCVRGKVALVDQGTDESGKASTADVERAVQETPAGDGANAAQLPDRGRFGPCPVGPTTLLALQLLLVHVGRAELDREVGLTVGLEEPVEARRAPPSGRPRCEDSTGSEAGDQRQDQRRTHVRAQQGACSGDDRSHAPPSLGVDLHRPGARPQRCQHERKGGVDTTRSVDLAETAATGLGADAQARLPPSTLRTWPLTWLASSDARNAIAAATSSGRPIEPKGRIVAVIRSMSAPSGGRKLPTIGVSIGPGATQFARTPSVAWLTARVRVRATTPPFDAAYGAW